MINEAEFEKFRSLTGHKILFLGNTEELKQFADWYSKNKNLRNRNWNVNTKIPNDFDRDMIAIFPGYEYRERLKEQSFYKKLIQL